MNELFQQFNQLVQTNTRFTLTTHERTDGDDFGSVHALAEYLLSQGKTVRIVIKGGVPESLRFLKFSTMVTDAEVTIEPNEILIFSGCNKIERAGFASFTEFTGTTVNFDHHPDNTHFASLNIVEPAKSSVAELIYDLYRALHWKIEPASATALLAGMFTDTGSFRHSNTQASTLRAVAYLLQAGGELHRVARQTYQGKSLQTLRAWGAVLENAEFKSQSHSIVGYADESIVKTIPGNDVSVFEGLVETLNKMPESKFAMLLKQTDKGIKGSLRSESYKQTDVQKIARTLGGGGHVLAAGFTVPGSITQNRQKQWMIVPPPEAE